VGLLAAVIVSVLSFLASPSSYELDLRVQKRDYFLPAPTQRTVVLRLDLRAAPPKARLMFTSPLAAGHYRVRIEVTGGSADRTMVIAVPVATGSSSFDVSIRGAGRFDLGFWADGPGAATREYRFTVTAPVEARTFQVDMPARPPP
jgi:hypothetical protein